MLERILRLIYRQIIGELLIKMIKIIINSHLFYSYIDINNVKKIFIIFHKLNIGEF